MKIGIDYSLATSTNRGMGRYIKEMVNALIKLPSNNQYILYTHLPISIVLPINFKERRLPISNLIIGEQWFLPHMAKKDKIDILWSPGNTFPLYLSKNIKLVVTIHDLIFMSPIRGKASIKQKIGHLYRKYILKYGHNRIDKCITVSKYSAKEIEQILGIKNIVITYNCIDTFYNLANTIETPTSRGNFYFTLSGDAPSKNLQHIIDTFKNNLQNEKLIIAGVPTKSSIRNQQNNNIIFLNYGISDIELIKWYKSCKAFIFLSIKEGFGIPLLEALVCDSPIICSNTTSIPEIVGIYAILIDPLNKEQLTKTIQQIDLHKINTSNKFIHLNKFLNWSESAQILLNNFIQLK